MGLKAIKAVLPALVLALASAPAVFGQTDVGISIFQAFNQSSTGTGTIQKQSNGPGGMVELRHIQSPWIGYELSYSLHPVDQALQPDPNTCVMHFDCQVAPEKFSALGQEVGVNWVPSRKVGNMRAFGVAGLGFVITVPGNYPLIQTNTPARVAYIYGGGLDVPLSPRFGLRVQYRGYLYKSPDVTFDFPSTGRFVQTSEPMAGIYFHL